MSVPRRLRVCFDASLHGFVLLRCRKLSRFEHVVLKRQLGTFAGSLDGNDATIRVKRDVGVSNYNMPVNAFAVRCLPTQQSETKPKLERFPKTLLLLINAEQPAIDLLHASPTHVLFGPRLPFRSEVCLPLRAYFGLLRKLKVTRLLVLAQRCEDALSKRRNLRTI